MTARTSGPADPALNMADLVGRVLAWGVPRMRDLPWRQSRDPWGILVAEVMAQQTQVDRVVQRWDRFLERFPTPAACAAAPLGDILREWQGLGYPRRARHLHESANRVVELGVFPSTLDGLLSLPGVGQYTARAVLAFAFESPAAVVDTNIARVLARTVGERLTAKRAQSIADELCPPEDSWVWNQVIMDLGAVLCRPAPRCAECPIQQQCVWTASGQPDPDPAIGTAGVSGKQARFEGSDRQARGRLMARLVAGPLSAAEAAAAMQVDAERAERLVSALVAEGLVVGNGESLRLP
ncbi:MAG: A/G-specific adenine glycosylase [Actinobacteria bacterium]|uniref:Adenine DNA glycosylase n=1 Tax=freshwater metagenome TaxID=449393 RepID=A0A6J6U618_9ZZZZ|nr:A/G-specific adenine glycosylase [Actinomycetota bacterium]MSZ03960.1 A/G-specific adenine glycosylase [Actinomycetota bacterium]MTB06586.1 A/G-specific adenine glycosylase [Actinomycetota bacterium]